MSEHDAIIDELWSRLEAAVNRRTDPFRTPTLATVSPRGDAEVRTVVLRSLSPHSRTLTLHTDTASAKFQALTACPRASLCFWDPKQRLQIRLRTDVSIETGPQAQPTFAGLSDSEKKQYGLSPEPGTPVQGPRAYGHRERYRFARLVCVVTAMDALWLSRPKHRRLQVDWTEECPASDWVVP